MAKFFFAWVCLVIVAIIAIPFVYNMNQTSPNATAYTDPTNPINGTIIMTHGFMNQMPGYLIPAILVIAVLAILAVVLLIWRRH